MLHLDIQRNLNEQSVNVIMIAVCSLRWLFTLCPFKKLGMVQLGFSTIIFSSMNIKPLNFKGFSIFLA